MQPILPSCLLCAVPLQHAGFFHILFGSIVLLSLGPAVEVAYGSFGFFAAYFTGGVFGNLMSYLQTADVTVGGTVSVFNLKFFCPTRFFESGAFPHYFTQHIG